MLNVFLQKKRKEFILKYIYKQIVNMLIMNKNIILTIGTYVMY